MKIKLLLFLPLLFLFQDSFSQSNLIMAIDAYVQEMKSKQDSYRKEEILNPEGKLQYAYFDDQGLRIITVEEPGKIKKNVDWYYKGTILIYTETNWTDSASSKNLYMEKTYHDKTGMIAWLNTENSFVNASSPEFKTLDRELGAYGRKIRDEALK